MTLNFACNNALNKFIYTITGEDPLTLNILLTISLFETGHETPQALSAFRVPYYIVSIIDALGNIVVKCSVHVRVVAGSTPNKD